MSPSHDSKFSGRWKEIFELRDKRRKTKDKVEIILRSSIQTCPLSFFSFHLLWEIWNLLPSSTVVFIERLTKKWKVEGDFRVSRSAGTLKDKDKRQGRGVKVILRCGASNLFLDLFFFEAFSEKPEISFHPPLCTSQSDSSISGRWKEIFSFSAGLHLLT